MNWREQGEEDYQTTRKWMSGCLIVYAAADSVALALHPASSSAEMDILPQNYHGLNGMRHNMATTLAEEGIDMHLVVILGAGGRMWHYFG